MLCSQKIETVFFEDDKDQANMAHSMLPLLSASSSLSLLCITVTVGENLFRDLIPRVATIFIIYLFLNPSSGMKDFVAHELDK